LDLAIKLFDESLAQQCTSLEWVTMVRHAKIFVMKQANRGEGEICEELRLYLANKKDDESKWIEYIALRARRLTPTSSTERMIVLLLHVNSTFI